MVYEGNTRGAEEIQGTFNIVIDWQWQTQGSLMCAKDCTTKRFNRVNSPGTLPTKGHDNDKESLISRPYGTRNIKSNAE